MSGTAGFPLPRPSVGVFLTSAFEGSLWVVCRFCWGIGPSKVVVGGGLCFFVWKHKTGVQIETEANPKQRVPDVSLSPRALRCQTWSWSWGCKRCWAWQGPKEWELSPSAVSRVGSVVMWVYLFPRVHVFVALKGNQGTTAFLWVQNLRKTHPHVQAAG